MGGERMSGYCKTCRRFTDHLRNQAGVPVCLVCGWGNVAGDEQFDDLGRKWLAYLRHLYRTGVLTEFPDCPGEVIA